jgi:hypothetical protein
VSTADNRVAKYLSAVKAHIEHHFNHPEWGKGSLIDRAAFAYSDEHLEWLESFCIGTGFNMGCGEIPIKDSIGVDLLLTLGCYDGAAFCSMDDLWDYRDGCADYIISNYIEAAPSPCKLFTEWYRLLRSGGTVAIVCRDAEDAAYDNSSNGPLQRSHRGNIKKYNCFTHRTIRFYLQFVGFVVASIEKDGVVLKIVAHK